MTGQTTFDFSPPAPRAPARAHRRDPSSSREAAFHVERSGTAQRQADEVLAALRRFPNSTSAELARSSGIARSVVARRLPELEEAGRVRDNGKNEKGGRLTSDPPCEVTGIRCVRWRTV